jgi:tRNA G18 (ribose-2'-O)-methylase SpoU
MLTVYLYRVGRNMNRAIRTCEAFGITDLRLVECAAGKLGNLYGASGRVQISSADELPPCGTWLEVGRGRPLSEVIWNDVSTLVVGGETAGLPAHSFVDWTHIPMTGKVSGLTVEAALAIALYARSIQC